MPALLPPAAMVMIAIANAWGEICTIPNSDSPELGRTFDTRGKTMKKVLLATTAMALSAGVAYAEVSVSGNARMGLQYNSAPAAGFAKTRIEKRMTIDMVGTTETSSGITFGAKLRIRSNEPNAGQGIAGARVYMQTSGFELAMGNIDGAIESMPNLYSPSVGLTGLGWQVHARSRQDTFTHYGRTIGDGRTGPMLARLQGLYRELMLRDIATRAAAASA